MISAKDTVHARTLNEIEDFLSASAMSAKAFAQVFSNDLFLTQPSFCHRNGMRERQDIVYIKEKHKSEMEKE